MSNNVRNARTVKELKRKEAAERQSYWNSLSTTEKLANLDRRLGKGVGAKKQRKKLEKLLAEEKA